MTDMTVRTYFDFGIVHNLRTEPHAWYVASPTADRYDFSGVGFQTLAEAKAEVRLRCSCTCGEGPFRDMTAQVNHDMTAHGGYGQHI